MHYKSVLTTCGYCGCGCGLYLEVLDGELAGTMPCKTDPVSRGGLCIKGWNVHEFVNSGERLSKPLVREGNRFREATWDEALQVTADTLKKIRDESGPDSIGFLCSAKCTNEENYLLQKLARAVIGTNNIDHCARLCHSSTVAGLAAAFGSGAMTNSIDEIEESRCIFVIGSNTTESHPLIGSRIMRAKEKGAKLIVADPRKIHLATVADIFVRQNLGTDVALLNGIMNVILKKGWHDSPFIEERTEGFEEFRKVVEAYTPEKVEKITGVKGEDIERIAEIYARSESSSIVYAMGITQHITGVDNVKSLANLAMLCGHIGRESTGVNPLRGQNNVQGACDMGGLPNVYPGYQAVTDTQSTEKFSKAWDRKLSTRSGLPLTEMLKAAEAGELKAMFILGENPMVSDADIRRVEKALRSLNFLVVQDIFMTESSRLAHVVLPGVSFAEKDGTFTNTERKVKRVRKALEPIGDSRQDWEIICDLAKRMDYKMTYASPSQIMEEIAEVTPIYGGIHYDRIEEDGLCWPCPDRNHPGTPYLHKDQFSRGCGLFHAVEYLPPGELPDDEYPYMLTTGRIYVHYHTGTMSRRSPSLNREVEEAYVEINPERAKELGISQGERIKIASRRGEIEIKADLSDRVEGDTIFIPFHFAESAANALTNPALDPIAKIPEYKVCAVRIEKVS
ncbi:MAG: formate dehydrogenase subunit alpha [Deltaproteobacteria bacterium]|nr:formate dehydrogenase subunit alpha [Deltaproteobacteria bacterium]